MLVNEINLTKGTKLSRKMADIVTTINAGGPETTVESRKWVPDLVDYSDEVWKVLTYTHRGLFGADKNKRDKERYFGVVSDDEKFVTMVSDMAVAATLLHIIEFRGLNILKSFVPESQTGKNIWEGIIGGSKIKVSDGTTPRMIDLLMMIDPTICEAPEEEIEAEVVYSDEVEKVQGEIVENLPSENTKEKDTMASVVGNVIYLGTTMGKEDIVEEAIVTEVVEQPKETKVEIAPANAEATVTAVVAPKEEVKETVAVEQPKEKAKVVEVEKPKQKMTYQEAKAAAIKAMDEEEAQKVVKEEKRETPGDIKIQEKEPVGITFGEAMKSLISFEDEPKPSLVTVAPKKSVIDKKNNDRYTKKYPELKQFVKMIDDVKYIVKFSDTTAKAYVHDDYHLISAQIYDPSRKMPYITMLLIDPNEIYNNGFNVLSTNRGNPNIFDWDCVKLSDTEDVLKMIAGGLTENESAVARNRLNVYAKRVLQIVDFRPALSDNHKVLPDKVYQLLLPSVWGVCDAMKAIYGVLTSVESEKKFTMTVAIDSDGTGIPVEYAVDFDPDTYKDHVYKISKAKDDEPVMVEEKKEAVKPQQNQQKPAPKKEEAKAAHIQKAAENGTKAHANSAPQKPVNKNK